MTRALCVAATLALVASSQPAAAFEICVDRTVLLKRLADVYGETLRSMGVFGGDLGVVELYVSEAGSFTIILSTPEGGACMLAVGEMWEHDAKPLTPSGDPT